MKKKGFSPWTWHCLLSQGEWSMGILLSRPYSKDCFTASLCEDPETDGLRCQQPLDWVIFTPRTFAHSSPEVWTSGLWCRTFPSSNMEAARVKEHGENSTSYQNASVFKDSELISDWHNSGKGKMRETSLMNLTESWAALDETSLVFFFSLQTKHGAMPSSGLQKSAWA